MEGERTSGLEVGQKEITRQNNSKAGKTAEKSVCDIQDVLRGLVSVAEGK